MIVKLINEDRVWQTHTQIESKQGYTHFWASPMKFKQDILQLGTFLNKDVSTRGFGRIFRLEILCWAKKIMPIEHHEG
jgi:hypothetical protein